MSSEDGQTLPTCFFIFIAKVLLVIHAGLELKVDPPASASQSLGL